MSKFSDFVKDNKLGSAFMVFGVIGLVLISGCQGWSVGDRVRFPVPQAVQDVTDSGEKVSVNEAPFVREDFINEFERDLGKFDRRYANAVDRAVIIESVLTTGLEGVLGSAFPAGGAIALALGGLGGLFIKGPGTSGRESAIGDRADSAGYARAMAEIANNAIQGDA